MQNDFTAEQLAFIDAVAQTSDSLRLDAVAGSGKTTTLLMAARGLKPDQKIIALAFNKNIADELSKKFPSHVHCKTLNGVGNGVWLKFQGKRQLDSRKLGDLTSKWCKENLEDKEAELLWNVIRTVVSTVKSRGLIPEEWANKVTKPAPNFTVEIVQAIMEANDLDAFNEELVFEAVRQIMLTSISEAFTSRIDFDDQIYMSTYFAPDEYWPQYDVVMVDEAQDLSNMQHDMIERLGAKSRLIVVGDERQAIYGWRGASCNSLGELTDRFGLKKFPLTVSFRCPERVIREAQRIVPYIQAHKPGGVVETYQSEDGRTPSFFLDNLQLGSVVLCRNNAPLIKLGFALITAGVPCYFTGKDIAAGLKKIVQGLPEGQPVLMALANWYAEETDNLVAKKRYDAVERLTDKYEALESIYLGAKATDKRTMIVGIDRLFMRQPTESAIELSTIHKAKGKEWGVVYFLNRHLIPGKWVAEAYANEVPGSEDLMTQEKNLEYVAITRALHTLLYININKDETLYTSDEWEEELKARETDNGD